MLGWEWAKHIERVGAGTNRMRGSLRALLGDGFAAQYSFTSHAKRAIYLHGQSFERYFRRADEIGLFSDHPTEGQLKAMSEHVSRAASIVWQ
jgi:hypothetical protein